jgi:hypothetical protein
MEKHENLISKIFWTTIIIGSLGNFFWMVAIDQPFMAVMSLGLATITLAAVKYLFPLQK